MARLSLATSWLLLLGLSVALSALAASNDTLPGDKGIITWVQERSFPGESLSDVSRALTSTQIVLGVGGFLVLLLLLLRRPLEAFTLLAGLIALPLLQSGLKEIIDRPRPGEPLVELRAGFSSPSFPAGHVMSPTVIYGFCAWLCWRRLRPATVGAILAAVCLLVVLLAGPVNVWLGVHWPSDVLGGWAWGLILLLPMLQVVELPHRQPPSP